MKLIINLSLIYFLINIELTGLVGSSQSFVFENLQNVQRRSNIFMPNSHAYEHPQPLPKTTLSDFILQSPYQNIYQGSRKPNDVRVYRQRFHYGPKASGHQVLVEGQFACYITHMAVETSGGIPILLRGGVGYHFFVVIAKAKPGNELKGQVRAYCVQKDDDYYKARV